MSIPANVFRQYDIRGTVGKELSDQFSFLLGRAFAKLAASRGKRNIAIGYDCRHSSPGFAKALLEGISAEGSRATFIGMGPTPISYWSLFSCGFDACMHVTGSHNPPDMNGYKMCIGQMTISGPDIQEIKKIMQEIENLPAKANSDLIGEKLILNDYIDYLIKASRPYQGSRKLKIVVDAGNGVGGMIAVPVLKALGHEVTELYCDPDGDFPNHHPDPTVLKNIKDLCAKVKEIKADVGMGFDGDADRLGIVDENGNLIFADKIVLLYAREVLKAVPGATIIGDVKCSSVLFKDIEKHGGKALMWKTGHSLIKSKMKEVHAELAGEMSGHIFFKHRFFGFDCANYCATRFTEILTNTDKKVSELLADVPTTLSTPEIQIELTDESKFKVVEEAQKAFPEFKSSTIDGIRIEFDHGWGLIRSSNTQPVIVMRFEAETQEQLEQYQNIVNQRLGKIRQNLGV